MLGRLGILGLGLPRGMGRLFLLFGLGLSRRLLLGPGGLFGRGRLGVGHLHGHPHLGRGAAEKAKGLALGHGQHFDFNIVLRAGAQNGHGLLFRFFNRRTGTACFFQQ